VGRRLRRGCPGIVLVVVFFLFVFFSLLFLVASDFVFCGARLSPASAGTAAAVDGEEAVEVS
jgi:hypothetical protein